MRRVLICSNQNTIAGGGGISRLGGQQSRDGDQVSKGVGLGLGSLTVNAH